MHATIDPIPVHPNPDAEIVSPTSDSEKDQSFDDKDKNTATVVVTTADPVNGEFEEEMDLVKLQKAFVFSVWMSVILCLLLVIVIPFPLFFTSCVFNHSQLILS